MRTRFTLCAAILGAGLPLFAQQANSRVQARMPINEALEAVQANSVPDTGSSGAGPSTPLLSPRRVSFHFDALYRRLGYKYDEWRADGSIYTRTAANAWEVPAVLRIALNSGRIRPFVGVGATMRLLSGIDPVRTGGLVAAGDTRTHFDDRADLGAVVSAGLVFKAGRLRIAPEVRYTRWGSQNLVNPINAFLRSERNQGDFVLAFTF